MNGKTKRGKGAERKRGKKPEYQLRIAKDRIAILLKEAQEEPAFAKRYVTLAKKIGMRYNVRIPKEEKKKYCKYCLSYFTAQNSSRRLKGGILNIKCFSCGKIMRIPYKNPI